jgi:hypothetical protein
MDIDYVRSLSIYMGARSEDYEVMFSSSRSVEARTSAVVVPCTPQPTAEDLADREGVWDPTFRNEYDEIEEEAEEEDVEDRGWMLEFLGQGLRVTERGGTKEYRLEGINEGMGKIRDHLRLREVRLQDLRWILPTSRDEEVIAWQGGEKGKRFKVMEVADTQCKLKPIEMVGTRLSRKFVPTSLPKSDLAVVYPLPKRR